MGYCLYGIVLIAFAVSGIRPNDRLTWVLELPWVFVGLAVCAVLWRLRIKFTTLLKLALFFHALILIYGAWYTYELVPLGEWMKDAFGFTRNNYDRLGHLAQGFFPAILFREVFFRNEAAKKGVWTEIFVFSACMAFTAIFELIEFAAALTFGSGADAFLGSQGDVWDAQWDMTMCGVGALISIAILGKTHLKELIALAQKNPENSKEE